MPERMTDERLAELRSLTSDLDQWMYLPMKDMLDEVDRLRAAEKLGRFNDPARHAEVHKREADAWRTGVSRFVDACCPDYCSEAANGPADLLPALEDAAPIVAAARAWGAARDEADEAEENDDVRWVDLDNAAHDALGALRAALGTEGAAP